MSIIGIHCYVSDRGFTRRSSLHRQKRQHRTCVHSEERRWKTAWSDNEKISCSGRSFYYCILFYPYPQPRKIGITEPISFSFLFAVPRKQMTCWRDGDYVHEGMRSSGSCRQTHHHAPRSICLATSGLQSGPHPNIGQYCSVFLPHHKNKVTRQRNIRGGYNNEQFSKSWCGLRTCFIFIYISCISLWLACKWCLDMPNGLPRRKGLMIQNKTKETYSTLIWDVQTKCINVTKPNLT